MIRSLEIICEAAGKVSPETRESHAEIPWRNMSDTRHRRIRGYAEVRLGLVWSLVQTQLPLLIDALLPMIPQKDLPGDEA